MQILSLFFVLFLSFSGCFAAGGEHKELAAEEDTLARVIAIYENIYAESHGFITIHYNKLVAENQDSTALRVVDGMTWYFESHRMSKECMALRYINRLSPELRNAWLSFKARETYSWRSMLHEEKFETLDTLKDSFDQHNLRILKGVRQIFGGEMQENIVPRDEISPEQAAAEIFELYTAIYSACEQAIDEVYRELQHEESISRHHVEQVIHAMQMCHISLDKNIYRWQPFLIADQKSAWCGFLMNTMNSLKILRINKYQSPDELKQACHEYNNDQYLAVLNILGKEAPADIVLNYEIFPLFDKLQL